MDRQTWNNLKEIVRHLYIEQNLNCKQVAAILREQHDDRVRQAKILIALIPESVRYNDT
jgi:hypothetical protein